MIRLTIVLTGFVSALLLAGCAGMGPMPDREDPLLGRIFSSEGEEVGLASMLSRMAASDVVYLGESHDNAIHHARQKQVIEALLARGLKPVIGFEFFDVGQTGFLTQYVSGQASAMSLHAGRGQQSPEQRLRVQLGWDARKDEDWQFYFQLIELARVHQLPVFGADLPASIRLRLSREGVSGLNAVERSQLVLIDNEVPGYRTLMYEKFRQGHCGWGEESLLARLYETWNQRNNRMAQSIVMMQQEHTEGPVVVILGNGHTEYNQAVVQRVALLAPELKQLNLAMQPIAIDPQPLEAYLQGSEVQNLLFGPRHDLFWFSQRASYDDPCAALKKPAE